MGARDRGRAGFLRGRRRASPRRPRRALQGARSDRTFSEWIHEAPSVLGVERMGQDALVMRVIADTRPSKVMDVERLLRERITRRLVERGIKVPVTPVAPAPSGIDGR